MWVYLRIVLVTKRYETFEHTADIGIAAEADSLGELYEALGEGLADFIVPRSQVGPREMRTVELSAEDAEALAVDFLTAVMNLLQAERFAVASVTVRDASEHHVTALVAGEPYDPTRHEINTEVKAVTYHQLKVANEGGRWVGRVILDL